ncbi:MAG: TetR/AcrR family transcriptional regulator [Sulfuritalea sp.]|jgi:TetR/AcrR family transcriptional repressor of nem operon|nr:TetR/AcrR family transcriptional regulator [Sulfuritalea sp.]MBK8760286.1 TetR/AcrR family transcriptional regulator [Sulfuritalea sp.]MBK9352099.1 TetR/AcrR family transcriptional regulator [Sulfuritalea sp.]
MPLSAEHKERTRARILAAAGRVFRRQGYAATAVDAVMAEAGLTRGGFYAHFPSKEALFAEVLAHDHGLIRMLAARRARSSAGWRRQTRRILGDWLAPDHLGPVREGCSFAALTADAARGGPEVRRAWGLAFERLVGELLRTPATDVDQALAMASSERRALAAQLAANAIGMLVVAAAGEDGLLRTAQAVTRAAVLEQIDRLLAS